MRCDGKGATARAKDTAGSGGWLRSRAASRWVQHELASMPRWRGGCRAEQPGSAHESRRPPSHRSRLVGSRVALKMTVGSEAQFSDDGVGGAAGAKEMDGHGLERVRAVAERERERERERASVREHDDDGKGCRRSTSMASDFSCGGNVGRP